MNTAVHSEIAPESTRSRILQAAHEEMYEHGFQGVRIEAVLKKTQLAKGALYHYFPTKMALGYAVVDEFIMGYFQQHWSQFMGASNDPLQALKDFFNQKCADIQTGECANGCPLTNLIQEMSTLDEGFHQRLRAVVEHVVCAVSVALAQGQVDGIVKPELNPQKTATFVLSSYQGIMGTAKCMQSMELAVDLFDTLGEYIESLRVKDTH